MNELRVNLNDAKMALKQNENLPDGATSYNVAVIHRGRITFEVRSPGSYFQFGIIDAVAALFKGNGNPRTTYEDQETGDVYKLIWV